MRQAWDSSLDPEHLQETLSDFTDVVEEIANTYQLAAVSIADDFYSEARSNAGVKGDFNFPYPDDIERSLIEHEIGQATNGLWADPTNTDPAFVLTSGAIQKVVSDSGRTSTLDAIRSDKQATGWARVTESDACFFCALLATRGATYESRESAGFQAHDHCQCSVMPVFKGQTYKHDELVQSWEDLYRHSSRVKPHGTTLLVAFRRAYEGRDIATGASPVING